MVHKKYTNSTLPVLQYTTSTLKAPQYDTVQPQFQKALHYTNSTTDRVSCSKAPQQVSRMLWGLNQQLFELELPPGDFNLMPYQEAAFPHFIGS